MVTVSPVTNNKDKKVFMKFPWKIYKDDPHWVAPLMMDLRKMFNPKKHPFYEYGEMELFLARRGEEVVGRIAAIHNPLFHDHHDKHTGFYGFFECVDDQQVANALFDTAKAWIKKKGMSKMHGPASPSSNYDYGLLIEGFNDSPRIMMTYNPEYYVKLYENYGLKNVKNLLAYKMDKSVYESEKLMRVAEMVKKRYKVTVRPLNMKDLKNEMELVKKVYNLAWEANWGHVPFSNAELDAMAADLKMVADADLITFGYVDGELAGMTIVLRDFYYIQKQLNGKITPFNFYKFFTQKKNIEWARVVVLGVVPEHQRKGIDAVFYQDITHTLDKKYGIKYCEGSWILEDNQMMNRGMKVVNGEVYKKYAVYEMAI